MFKAETRFGEYKKCCHMLDGTNSHKVLSACGLIMANGSMGRLHISFHHCPQSNKGFHCEIICLWVYYWWLMGNWCMMRKGYK